MASRSYPERNPFPAQGAVTVESLRFQVATDGGPDIQPLPTLELEPVARLRSLVERYLQRFRPSERGHGLPVAIRGAHGVGKTHGIRYVMGKVAAGEIRAPQGVPEPFQIYVRAESTDFMTIYRQMMRQVPLNLLRDQALRFLAFVGSQMFGMNLESEVASERAAQLVRDDPNRINEAFRQYLIGRDDALYRQAEEVRNVSGTAENFQNAVRYLLHDDLAAVSYKWLLGEKIGPAEIQKIGVSAPIETPDVARWALRLLAALFTRGGRPLIFYTDQYEKLILNADGSPHAENMGLIRALIDEIAQESAMFVLAGNEEAWAAVAKVRDLRQRFADFVIEFPVVTFEEAKDLVRLYLSAGRNNVLQLWSPGSGEDEFTLTGHALPIRAVAVTADGTRAVSASKDSTLKVWDLRRRHLICTLLGHDGSVNAVAVTPDGKRAISGGDDHSLRIWDMATGAELGRLMGHTAWVNAVAVTDDGRKVISGASDRTIRIWDLASGQEMGVLTGHEDSIWALAVSPDGRTLVSASTDATLRVWDLENFTYVRTLSGHGSWVNGVALTPDGQSVVSISDDTTMRVWDLETGRNVRTLAGNQKAVRGLALIDDRHQAVTAAIDGAYKFWDLPTGEQLGSAVRPIGTTCAFAIIPRTSRLVSAVSEVFKPGGNDEELYPFTVGAVQSMLRNGVGNTRRLLQICWDSFEAAFPTKDEIDEACVEQVLRKGGRPRIDRDTVTVEIERLLAESGQRFQRQYRVGSTTADFAVLAADGRPLLLVQLTGALFGLDEAHRALGSITLLDAVRAENLPARVILVVLGYVSPEVTEQLRRVVHEYIVYDPERFSGRFREVLASLPVVETAQPVDKDAEDSDLRVTLAAVKEALEQIRQARTVQTTTANEQMSSYFQRHASDRSTERREDARREWAAARKQAEDEIRERRDGREERVLAELEQLRSAAERRRMQSRLILAGIVGFLGFVAAVIVWLSNTSNPTNLGWINSFLFGLATALVVLGLVYLRTPAALRALAGHVVSVPELDRLAQTVADNATRSRGPDWQKLLGDANPQYRYAAVLSRIDVKYAQQADWQATRDRLAQALRQEHSALVRRLIVQWLSRSSDVEAVLLRTPWLPDLAYVVEALAGRDELRWPLLQALPISMWTLAAIAGADPEEIFPARGEGAASFPAGPADGTAETPAPLRPAVSGVEDIGLPLQMSLALRGRPLTPLGEALARAYRAGLDRAEDVALDDIPYHRIQAALQELTPLQDDGLGAYDELRNLDKVDRSYMFFLQLQFLADRDLLPAGAPAREEVQEQ